MFFLLACALILLTFVIAKKQAKKAKKAPFPGARIGSLRKVGQYYKVQETNHLFGDFDEKRWRENGYDTYTVFALNPEQAIRRYCKRHNYLAETTYKVTNYGWAKYRVQPISKPFERFTTYYW